MNNGFYHIRLMASLVISLLAVILCFKLPLKKNQPATVPQNPQLKSHRASSEVSKIPILPTMIPLHGTAIPKSRKDSVSNIKSVKPATKIPILKQADIMPKIRGGLRAYYILIEYPEEAINQGIEGNLVLTFTVNKNGATSNIVVSKPLHALLDSAAVKALRQAHFIPGQHLGKSARVQMRLPVRFKLLNPANKELSPPKNTPK